MPRQRLVMRVFLGNGGFGEHVPLTDGLAQLGDEIGHGLCVGGEVDRVKPIASSAYTGRGIG